MKKFFILLVMLVIVFNMTACSNNEGADKETSKKQEESVNTETKKLTGNMKMKDEDGNVLITIDDVDSVEVQTVKNDTGAMDYCVNIKFTDEGGKRFADITQQLIGKQLGIYVDDELVSNPTIMSAITNGEAMISNFNSYEDAMALVELIRGSGESVKNEPSATAKIKITENDGTILATETEIDFVSMEVMSIGKGGSNVDVIILTFTDEGNDIMAEKTAKLIGEEINIVVNGELVYDAKLESAITDGKLIISGFADKKEEMDIFEKINDNLK